MGDFACFIFCQQILCTGSFQPKGWWLCKGQVFFLMRWSDVSAVHQKELLTWKGCQSRTGNMCRPHLTPGLESLGLGHELVLWNESLKKMLACLGSRVSPACLEQKKISSLQEHPSGHLLTWCRCWLLEGHLSWGLHLASGNVVPAAGTATVATAASSPLLPSWLLPSPSAGRQGLTSGVLQVRSFTCSHWTRIRQSMLQAGECW